MRIISKWHDYYDVGMRYGLDRSLVYRRTKEVVKGEQPQLLLLRNYRWGWLNHPDIHIASAVIGFCGKVYPVVVIRGINFLYTYEDVNSYLEGALTERQYQRCKTPAYGKGFLHQARAFFQHYADKQDDFMKWFVEWKVPVFVADHVETGSYRQRITLNDKLADWRFFRLLDPITTYQEIAGFLGGVLAQPVKPIPEIDDETMAQIKGFDEQSFKTPPGGTKTRKIRKALRKKKGKS